MNLKELYAHIKEYYNVVVTEKSKTRLYFLAQWYPWLVEKQADVAVTQMLRKYNKSTVNKAINTLDTWIKSNPKYLTSDIYPVENPELALERLKTWRSSGIFIDDIVDEELEEAYADHTSIY